LNVVKGSGLKGQNDRHVEFVVIIMSRGSPQAMSHYVQWDLCSLRSVQRLTLERSEGEESLSEQEKANLISIRRVGSLMIAQPVLESPEL